VIVADQTTLMYQSDLTGVDVFGHPVPGQRFINSVDFVPAMRARTDFSQASGSTLVMRALPTI